MSENADGETTLSIRPFVWLIGALLLLGIGFGLGWLFGSRPGASPPAPRPATVVPAATEPPALPTLTPTPTLALLLASPTSPRILATATPTSSPTATSVTPALVVIGGYARVVNTSGAGMSFRSGPGLNYARLSIVAEGAILKVVGGPETADGYAWWRLQAPDGTFGWAADAFLAPAAKP